MSWHNPVASAHGWGSAYGDCSSRGWSEDRRRRQRKQSRRGPRSRSEWECPRCAKTNWMHMTHCRGCQWMVNGEEKIWWGISETSAPPEGIAPTQKQARQQQPHQREPPTQPKPHQSHATIRDKIAAAKEQLAAVQKAGLSETILQVLRAEIAQLEQDKAQLVPLGARLDSAKARVARAEYATQQAKEEVERANLALHTAQAEQLAAEDEYRVHQAALDQTEEVDMDVEHPAVAALDGMLSLLEQQPNLPPQMAEAVRMGRESLSRSRSNSRKRNLPKDAATEEDERSDSPMCAQGTPPRMKASPARSIPSSEEPLVKREEISPTQTYHQEDTLRGQQTLTQLFQHQAAPQLTQMSAPSYVALKDIDPAEEMDDAAFGQAVRERMQPKGPYTK